MSREIRETQDELREAKETTGELKEELEAHKQRVEELEQAAQGLSEAREGVDSEALAEADEAVQEAQRELDERLTEMRCKKVELLEENQEVQNDLEDALEQRNRGMAAAARLEALPFDEAIAGEVKVMRDALLRDAGEINIALTEANEVRRKLEELDL